MLECNTCRKEATRFCTLDVSGRLFYFKSCSECYEAVKVDYQVEISEEEYLTHKLKEAL